ncbi:MAG: L,D-transpeptidase [Chloroflexi bacterium]|nr:L,D-transpeptidase [Chloroflexota bacterium]
MAMKKLILILLTVMTITFAGKSAAVYAQAEITPEIPAVNNDMALCLPGIYLETPDDCLPLGSSQILTDLARKGLTVPLKPLPASKPSADYVNLDQNYAKLNLQPGVQAAFYPNLDSAVAGINAFRFLPAGDLLYIAYTYQSDVGGKHFVQVENGEWVRASPTYYSTFQGLHFSKTPSNSFGWILDQNKPSREPGYQADLVNETLVREQIVQVYDAVEAGNTTWYMIGLGKWVEQRYIAVVNVMPSPPDGVINGRWIEVNLYQQTLAVYDNNQLVFATIIATGVDPYFTQPGLFQIYEKKELETMTGAFAADKSDYYYLESVPWTMYFDQNRALHGAYWRALFGYPQSHGCVNLSVGDSHWLYDWANVGDWVYVWDPSGKTPTDPSFYGQGGA